MLDCLLLGDCDSCGLCVWCMVVSCFGWFGAFAAFVLGCLNWLWRVGYDGFGAVFDFVF